MKQIKFTAPVKGGNHFLADVTFKDGEIKELPDNQADTLVSDFPDQFSIVGKVASPSADTDKSKDEDGKKGK